MNMIRKTLVFLLAATVIGAFHANVATAKNYNYKKYNKKLKNVIVMVPDGCSASIQTLARWVKGAPLNLDGLNTGSVKTYMANSVITGSAAAATAFATGHKTSVRFLGVGPSETSPKGDDLGFLPTFTPTAAPFAPVESILEVAKRNGKATGLIATSRITHATPAAYACHIDDRGKDNEIMEHMVYQDIDVVFGGGARHLTPENETYETSFGDKWDGLRTDGEDLIKVLLDREYAFVDSKDGMNAVTSGRVWGMFDDSHMDPDLDRDDFHPTQPSIAEMTRKAIELLSQNPDGFFLMVEGSQVDWAGHANDPVYMVSDFLAFDDAVGQVLEFAKADKRTLVMIFPDHNTGALSIGHEQGPGAPSYTSTSFEALIDPIKDATITVQGLLEIMPNPPSPEDVQKAFLQYWGNYWADMRYDQAEKIANLGKDSYGVSEYLSCEFMAFGWTTHGHSGEDVPLWSYGPNRPVGTFDNTDLATIAADAFGFNLMGSAAWFEVDDSKLDMTDSENPVVKIGRWRYPVGKDYKVSANGRRIRYFSDITVWAPAVGKVYIPKR
jgi:alkaline phosphatase